MVADPRRLAVLGAVARAGGVLAAAQLLHVTPSAVSQQLARLEREVGVALLDRGPRGVTLTPAGRLLADTAERIEVELAVARRALAEVTGRVSGPVVVGAFTTAIRHLVAPALARLATESPGVVPRVVDGNESGVLNDLRRGTVDLAVVEHDRERRTTAPHPALRAVPLLDEPWLVAVPHDRELPAVLPDLAGVPWVIGRPGSAARLALDRIAGEQRWSVHDVHEVLEFPAALALVAAGLGYALVPALALPDQLPPQVRVTRLAGLGARQLVLYHRSGRAELDPLVRTVTAALVRRAGELTITW